MGYTASICCTVSTFRLQGELGCPDTGEPSLEAAMHVASKLNLPVNVATVWSTFAYSRGGVSRYQGHLPGSSPASSIKIEFKRVWGCPDTEETSLGSSLACSFKVKFASEP